MIKPLRETLSWVSSGDHADKRGSAEERAMAAAGNDAFETIEVTGHRVACDGGNGSLGHPRVFLEIPEDEHKVVCPYCSRTYVMVDGADEHAA